MLLPLYLKTKPLPCQVTVCLKTSKDEDEDTWYSLLVLSSSTALLLQWTELAESSQGCSPSLLREGRWYRGSSDVSYVKKICDWGRIWSETKEVSVETLQVSRSKRMQQGWCDGDLSQLAWLRWRLSSCVQLKGIPRSELLIWGILTIWTSTEQVIQTLSIVEGSSEHGIWISNVNLGLSQGNTLFD